MARKVSLINMKGGVGKSTLTVQLGWYFALAPDSKNVLIVDLDPQFNASQYLLGPSEYSRSLQNGQRTVWDILERRTRHPNQPAQQFPARDAVYNRQTFQAGNRLDVMLSRLELSYSLKTPYQQKEQELADAIAEVESSYDLILIDCAPTESLLTTAAYLASDYILVPVRPEYLSAIGLPLLVQSMGEFGTLHPAHPLQLAGLVFNATDNYAPEEMRSKLEVRNVATQNGWHIFGREVPYSRSYPKSAREGSPIYWTSYARNAQKNAFSAFALEFAQRIGL